MARRWVHIFAFLGTAAWGSSPLHPHLPDSRATEIQALFGSPAALRAMREGEERRYQESIQRQVLSDVAEIYSPQNEAKVQIAYGSFTPELDPEPGEDLGYGFHVIKRLEIPLRPGGVKVVEVNEAWPENRNDGSLLAPVELRMKTRIFEGARHVPGSERLFLYDRVHLTWGPEGQVKILRRTGYSGNGRRVQRSLLSAPSSCLRCHDANHQYADSFTLLGQARDFESIVQPAHYRLPVAQMKGYRDYFRYLTRSRKSPGLIADLARSLAEPVAATQVPGLYRELRDCADRGNIEWIGDDDSASSEFYRLKPLSHQGVYLGADGSFLLEAPETTFEGKYRWWTPVSFLPFAHPSR